MQSIEIKELDIFVLIKRYCKSIYISSSLSSLLDRKSALVCSRKVKLLINLTARFCKTIRIYIYNLSCRAGFAHSVRELKNRQGISITQVISTSVCLSLCRHRQICWHNYCKMLNYNEVRMFSLQCLRVVTIIYSLESIRWSRVRCLRTFFWGCYAFISRLSVL